MGRGRSDEGTILASCLGDCGDRLRLPVNEETVFLRLAVEHLLHLVVVHGFRKPVGELVVLSEKRLGFCSALFDDLETAIAGFAGTLSAQHTQFITPVLLDWTTSGEALIMLILGGLGTLIGPVIGAAVVTLLRHELEAIRGRRRLTRPPSRTACPRPSPSSGP